MGEWGAKAPLEPALWHFQSQNQELGGPRRLGKRSWQTKRLFRFLGCATPLSPPDLGRCSCAPGNFSKPPDLVSTSSFFRWQLGHPGATLAAPLPLWSPFCALGPLASLLGAPSTCPLISGDFFLSDWAVHSEDRPEPCPLVCLQFLGHWCPVGAQSMLVK